MPEIAELTRTPGPEYYQIAFRYLHLTLGRELEDNLLARPRSIRAKALSSVVQQGVALDGQSVWPKVLTVLPVLELEMQNALRHRSVAFWLHVYRRIGVFLSPRHEDKTDARTNALVRELVELAICKYARLDEATEFVPSTHLHVDKVLGGVLRAAIKAASPRTFSASCRAMDKYLKGTSQWVLRDFSPSDFVGIYFVEGVAYQYWRITALLRTLGKGTKVEFDNNGDWIYRGTEEFDALIRSIDERTNDDPFQNSLLGVWFQRKDYEMDLLAEPFVVAPVYNVERIQSREIFDPKVLLTGEGAVTNFLPAFWETKGYLQAHQRFSEALLRTHGFGLPALIYAMWALSLLVLLPEGFISASASDLHHKQLQNLFNLCQRGYRMLGSGGNLCAEIREIFRIVGGECLNVSTDELNRVVAFLELTTKAQGVISLWSGGPRHLILPFKPNYLMIDLHPAPMILQNLFVKVQHDQGLRGPLFEEEFRKALTAAGYVVSSGRLISASGEEREIDAGVLIDSTLVVFECVSIERPLDYEIGNPATISYRCDRLDSKVGQVISLVEFLKKNPIGRNYTFESVANFEGYVVSAFHEWIWDSTDRLWLNGWPRILSVDEALRLLSNDY